MANEDDTVLGDVFPEIGEDEVSANGNDPDSASAFDPTSDESTPTETRPTRVLPRSSTANLFGLLWGGAGMLLVQSQADVPVGRVLQLQSPMAGAKLDQAIAGTWLDKALQPFVKVAEGAEGFGALFLFPALVAVCERQPDLYPVLYPVIREVVEVSLGELAPALRKQRTASAKNVKAVADITKDLNIDVAKGQDPIDAFLQTIFAPPVVVEQPVETEPTTDA